VSERSIAFSTTVLMVAPAANLDSCSTQLSCKRFRTATSPWSGFSVPARIRNNVDFPEPFGPIRPIRSPSETVKETSSKSGLAPNAFVIFCALMIGGNGYAPQHFRGYQETQKGAWGLWKYRIRKDNDQVEPEGWPERVEPITHGRGFYSTYIRSIHQTRNIATMAPAM